MINIILTAIALFIIQFVPHKMSGTYAHAGFAFCNGQLLSIADNNSLFAIIDTIYGGNGTTNFALPDLRGSVPVGIGSPSRGESWVEGEKSN